MLIKVNIVQDKLDKFLWCGKAGVTTHRVRPVGLHNTPKHAQLTLQLLSYLPHDGYPKVAGVRVLVNKLLIVDRGQPGMVARGTFYLANG